MTKLFKVAIVDYEMGNVKSIENAINHVGDYHIIVTSHPEDIISADCIVLPGVGAFPDAMKKLKKKNLIEVLNRAVISDKTPTLGICLGMQLLFEYSEEKESTSGLGWIPGHVAYMKPAGNLRVPHVGWNSLILSDEATTFDFLGHDKDFYFVHSLYAQCSEKYIIAKFEYGGLMTASVKKDNIFGMQFHPEKSQKNGLNAMRSFLTWAKNASGPDNA